SLAAGEPAGPERRSGDVAWRDHRDALQLLIALLGDDLADDLALLDRRAHLRGHLDLDLHLLRFCAREHQAEALAGLALKGGLRSPGDRDLGADRLARLDGRDRAVLREALGEELRRLVEASLLRRHPEDDREEAQVVARGGRRDLEAGGGVVA